MYFNTNKEGNVHFPANTEKNIFNPNKVKAVKNNKEKRESISKLQRKRRRYFSNILKQLLRKASKFRRAFPEK